MANGEGSRAHVRRRPGGILRGHVDRARHRSAGWVLSGLGAAQSIAGGGPAAGALVYIALDSLEDQPEHRDSGPGGAAGTTGFSAPNGAQDLAVFRTLRQRAGKLAAAG